MTRLKSLENTPITAKATLIDMCKYSDSVTRNHPLYKYVGNDICTVFTLEGANINSVKMLKNFRCIYLEKKNNNKNKSVDAAIGLEIRRMLMLELKLNATSGTSIKGSDLIKKIKNSKKDLLCEDIPPHNKTFVIVANSVLKNVVSKRILESSAAKYVVVKDLGEFIESVLAA